MIDTKVRIEHGSIWKHDKTGHYVLILHQPGREGEWYSWIYLSGKDVITGGPNDTRGNLHAYSYVENVFRMIEAGKVML